MPGHLPEGHVEVGLARVFPRVTLAWSDETGAATEAELGPGEGLPAALLDLLRRKARPYVRAPRGPNDAPRTLPVFLHEDAAWVEAVALPRGLRDRVTFVRHAAAGPEGAPTLPLDVALLDADVAAQLGGIGLPGVRVVADPRAAEIVVVSDAETLRALGPTAARLVVLAPADARLGLPSVHDRRDSEHAGGSRRAEEGRKPSSRREAGGGNVRGEPREGEPPGNPACVLLSGDLAPAAAVEGLLAQLTHDLPLHDAVRRCGDARAVLVCSPAANQAFRISRAADALADDAVALCVSGCPLPQAAPLRERPLDYGHEWGGAGPLAGVAADVRTVRASLAAASGARAMGPAPEADAPRVADVRLRRLDGSPLTRGRPADAAAFVQPGDTLRRGARYELRFQVGAPTAGTLVEGPAPAIDPLLPPLPEGARHTLQVVVYPQDFALGSPALQPITLGERGASDVARFVVVAPKGRRRARLRVSVYHADVLLQSFRVEARVGPEERALAEGKRGVTARLDYARTPDLATPDGAPRFACVSVNDAADGAHDVMVKRDGTVGGARISLAQADDALKAFRDTMVAMTRNTNGQRYTVGVTPPLARFAEDVYRLAVQGWELAHALFDGNPAGVELLGAMKTSADRTLQLVRLSPRMALPWATLYDWDLPEDPPADVCLGDQAGAPCGHGPASGVLCVRGFWGIRHRLEELVHTGLQWPDALGPGPRLVAFDPAVRGWEGLAPLPGGFTELAPDAPLIDTLDGAPRPAVLAILGHHAARPPGTASLALPRIEVGPGARRLTRKALLERCHTLPRWEGADRPLVLLMACDTAAPLDPYPDFVAPLLTKGALGVVATECIVYPDLVGLATRRLLLGLAGGAALVDALRALRLELLRARNPLGFVFTAIGSADLHLA